MNRFVRQKRQTPLLFRFLLPALLFLCFSLALVRSASSLSETAENAEQDSLKQAITRSAIHAYAMEGRYPESLQELREDYGISWDEDKYVVDYEIIGSNLMPSVSVIPLRQ